MKKAREVLSKRDGFSLVELIVVIVIMLVLAAVMVPNVMKYIGMASEASTKNDAASMLTQIQADVADAVAEAYQNHTSVADALTALKPSLGGVEATKAATADAAKVTSAATVTAKYFVNDKYQVTAFCYADGSHYINWTETKGWWGVDKATAPSTTE